MVDQVRELGKHFQGVVIALKKKDKNVPIRVHRFHQDDERRIVIRYNVLGSDNMTDVIFKEEDYILDCPQVGMTQVQGKVVYLRRVPERQWKRGYTENIVRSEQLSDKEFREVGLSPIRVTHKDLIKEVYNTTYTNMGNGMIDLLKGKIFSFAISRKFAIGLKWNSKFPVVYYKEWVVGWVEEGTIILPQKAHHLFEELSQYTSCRRV